jgi:hypothetical protein
MFHRVLCKQKLAQDQPDRDGKKCSFHGGGFNGSSKLMDSTGNITICHPVSFEKYCLPIQPFVTCTEPEMKAKHPSSK